MELRLGDWYAINDQGTKFEIEIIKLGRDVRFLVYGADVKKPKEEREMPVLPFVRYLQKVRATKIRKG